MKAKVAVDKAAARLARAVINGQEWEVFDETQGVISALRRARTAGVSESWVSKEIDFAERTAEVYPCHDCIVALEAAR